MQVVKFECPYCSADLKMRSEEFVGRTVGCPDCRKSILLRREEAGTLMIERAEQPPEPKKKSSRTPVEGSKSKVEDSPKRTNSRDAEAGQSSWTMRSPRFQGIAAGAIGAAILLGGLAYFLWSRTAHSQTAVPDQAEVVQGSPATGTSEHPIPTLAQPRGSAVLPGNLSGAKNASATLAGGRTMPGPGKPSVSGSDKVAVAGGPASHFVQSSPSPTTAHAATNSPSVSGPNSTTPSKPTKTMITRMPIEAPRPVVKNAPPTVDVAAGLRLRFAQFEQPKPVPLKDVLDMLQEILAVPIRSDKQEIADLDDLMQTPVTFNLRNTTTEAVLRAVLAKANLTFEIEPDAIRLRKSPGTTANGTSANGTSAVGTSGGGAVH